jgi:hypothetical protein
MCQDRPTFDLEKMSEADLRHDIGVLKKIHDSYWWWNDFWGEKRKSAQEGIRRREEELRRRGLTP